MGQFSLHLAPHLGEQLAVELLEEVRDAPVAGDQPEIEKAQRRTGHHHAHVRELARVRLRQQAHEGVVGDVVCHSTVQAVQCKRPSTHERPSSTWDFYVVIAGLFAFRAAPFENSGRIAPSFGLKSQ